MGSVKLILLLKYGIPLAMHLIADGTPTKDASENAVAVVHHLMELDNIPQELVDADTQKASDVIDGMFQVIKGVTTGLYILLSSLLS